MRLPVRIEGIVVHGQKRGRLLGFPTANILADHLATADLQPGVYISQIVVNNQVYKAATSIGVVSTFDQSNPTIEAHILDFNQDIYDQKVTLTLLSKIREMQKYNSVVELVDQIKSDVQIVNLT
jgi:riboflavin kinase / FMN adenylyltransferase